MPRPVVTTVNPRYRKWCCVIHNVLDLPAQIKSTFSDCVRLAYSVEPYNHQEGNHVHIFVEYKNPHYKHALLKVCNTLSESIRDPSASGEGLIGRVQLDKMRGNFEQAMKYLVNPDKDKKLGHAELLDREEETNLWIIDQLFNCKSFEELKKLQAKIKI